MEFLLVLLSIIVSITQAYHNTDGICQANVHVATFSNKIIDIKQSIKHGARLLKGVEVMSHTRCIQDCCYVPNCDLALYRTDEQYQYKKRGSGNHNCYYVHCGNLTNCVLANHEEFTSFYITRNHHVSTIGNGREHADGLLINHYKVTSTLSYKETAMSKGNTVTSSLLLAVPSSSLSYTSSSTVAKPLDITSTSNTMRSMAHTSMLANQPISTPVNHDSLNTNDNMVSSGDHVTEEPDHVTPEAHDDDEPCWRSGCGKKVRGGDIIAGVVVSVLALAFLSILSGVVIRKFYKNRQTRHYHNVDYLINGMYT